MNGSLSKEDIIVACKEAIQQELGHFFIEREQHFLDHTFIKSVRETKDNVTNTACKVATKGGMVGLGVLIAYGFIEWLKKIGVNVAGTIAKYL